mmetsp:Transcript_45887/g.127325  ORF Transcript_45887/g.127325 Transcript_45887/m.127325 type:complete len:217 (+) Transcript_45887:145-795(+)
MYALRSINNLYSEHAGKRSDFVILGHPEFKNGKARSDHLSEPWDTRRALQPRRNLARSRSLGALVGQLSYVEPRAPYKVRSRERESARVARADAPALREDMDAFLSELAARAEESPSIEVPVVRTATSHAKTMGWTPVCRHATELNGSLGDLRERLLTDPIGTRKKLQASGSWKYYAEQLERARRAESQFKRDRRGLESAMRASLSLQATPFMATA